MKRYESLQSFSVKRSDEAAVHLHHARLTLQPDMNTGRITSARVDFNFTTTAAIGNLQFDLRRELSVDSVVMGLQKLSFVHQSNHILFVTFKNTLPSGTTDSLRIYYKGMPDMSTRAYFRSVNVSGASVSTLSQPYGAHYWWPCRESLKDKIDSIDFVLTVDTPYYAVANGSLKKTETLGNQRVFYYSHRYPSTNYLVAVSFSKYSVYKDSAMLGSLGKKLDIINHVFPHNDDAANRARTAATGPIMHLFDSLFGAYPFDREHYGHAQFGWSGGMEHQTMSFMANFGYDLIAHELGHQWFGDKVTCGTWKDIWLNEGFATYSNLLCYNFLKPRSEWINQLKAFKDDVLSETGGSVYAYDTTDVNQLFNYRTTYQKGALVLHQLRYLVGDTAFFKGIRNYLADSRLAYGYAVQKDLQTHLEQSSGMNLNRYFNDWIMGEGYPKYDLTWSQAGRELRFKVTQLTTHPSVKQFNVPIPILVRGSNQEKLIRIPVTDTVYNFTSHVEFKVKSIEIDPDEWLLARFSQHFSLEENTASLYPNPFNQIIYLTMANFEIKSVVIYDLCGRKVEEKSFAGGIGRGEILAYDASVLQSGIYTIEIKGDSESVVRKIVKQ